MIRVNAIEWESASYRCKRCKKRYCKGMLQHGKRRWQVSVSIFEELGLSNFYCDDVLGAYRTPLNRRAKVTR